MSNKNFKKPETRYHIFISSPFEPSWVRALAQQSIVLAGHVPYLYEQRTQVRTTIDSIHELIDDSQIYILLLGHRLGSRPTADSKTYTELEFYYALSNPNIHKIVALYQNRTEIENERKNTDREEKKSERDFWNFYDYVTQDPSLLENEKYIHAPWSSHAKEALSARITAIVSGITKDLDRLPNPIGWVRATDVNTQEEVLRSLENKIRVEIVKKFNQFDKLDERCKVEKESKLAIAKKIHEVFLPIIFKERYNLFLDSGSTIAYVAQRIGDSIKTNIHIDNEGQPDIEILTNNVLAHLYLWLVSEVPCKMFPPGVPEMPYGAAYGPISDFGKDKISKEIGPYYGRDALGKSDQDRIDRIEKMFSEGYKDIHSKLFTIGTISGVKLGKGDDVPLDWGDNEEDENTRKEIIESQGFHTGNYFHMLFKRFFYVNDYPAVVCVHEQKLDGPVRIGQCDFVFDKSLTWEDYIKNKPLAFCVGFQKNNIKSVIKKIEDTLGFEIIKPRETRDTHQAIIAVNKKFKERVDI
jgi:hypothetical protein